MFLATKYIKVEDSISHKALNILDVITTNDKLDKVFENSTDITYEEFRYCIIFLFSIGVIELKGEGSDVKCIKLIA